MYWKQVVTKQLHTVAKMKCRVVPHNWEKKIELAEDAIKADVSWVDVQKEVVGNHALGIMHHCGLFFSFFLTLLTCRRLFTLRAAKKNKYSNLTHNGDRCSSAHSVGSVLFSVSF